MALPWIDTWAPAQFVTTWQSSVPNLTAGATDQNGSNVNGSQQSTYDPTIAYKMAGTIIGALVLVYVLQHLGFRFVGSVSTGVGR